MYTVNPKAINNLRITDNKPTKEMKWSNIKQSFPSLALMISGAKKTLSCAPKDSEQHACRTLSPNPLSVLTTKHVSRLCQKCPLGGVKISLVENH